MRRHLCAVLLAAILVPLVIGLPSGTIAAPSGTSGVPVAVNGQGTPASPEEELVQRHAPIIGLKDQEAACDDSGEPFFPVSVDVVLGNDTVMLKRATAANSSQDEVIAIGPVAADLYAKGDGYYLDLPGNPRRPGCAYEQWFDQNSPGFEPMTYAHIIANGVDRLVIQYWFFYVFNNFNNTHESDWEMMQISFDVGTVEDALATEPTSVAIAQHGGGELADWDDDKLQKDGSRPIVYSAAGSHATQYENAVYLGWGSNGTGFGCDITTTPGTLVPLNVVLLPHRESDPASELAWLNFAGRWGERQPGEFNGPTGPATKRQWTSPFLWQEGLRDSSLEVPLATTFGPAPTEVFCTLSTAGSNLFRILGDSRFLLLGSAIVILSLIAAMVRYAWPTVRAAGGLYRREIRTFLVIGLLLIPVGIAFNGFQYLVTNIPPGSTVIGMTGKSPGSYYAFALLALIGQLLASLLVVGPMVVGVFDAIEKRREVDLGQVVRNTIGHVPGLAKSIGLVALVVVLLSMTVIGVPIAIWLLVRWGFVAQATVLDDVDAREALARSSASVRNRWWRVGILTVCLAVIGSVPGVVVGLGLLVFGSASVQATNVVSSLLYVATVPLTILGLTMVYRNRSLTPPFFPRISRLLGRGEVEIAPAAARVDTPV